MNRARGEGYLHEQLDRKVSSMWTHMWTHMHNTVHETLSRRQMASAVSPEEFQQPQRHVGGKTIQPTWHLTCCLVQQSVNSPKYSSGYYNEYFTCQVPHTVPLHCCRGLKVNQRISIHKMVLLSISTNSFERNHNFSMQKQKFRGRLLFACYNFECLQPSTNHFTESLPNSLTPTTQNIWFLW